jgi:hypothetical protein
VTQEIPDVGADSEVVQFAGINRDAHAIQNTEFRRQNTEDRKLRSIRQPARPLIPYSDF